MARIANRSKTGKRWLSYLHVDFGLNTSAIRAMRFVWRSFWSAVVGVTLASVGGAQAPDTASARWMQSVLDRWETIATQHLRIAPQPLAWVVFYDARSAFHLSADTTRLPKPSTVVATLRFGGRSYPVRRVENAGRVWVPDRDPLRLEPVALTMVYDNGRKPMTVIPLPPLFRQMATPEHAAELDQIFLNSAVHELTHTRHVVAFARRVDSLRAKFRLPENLGDNVIQDRFGGDTLYLPMFEEERDALFQAVFARNADTARAFIKEALKIADDRKATFFSDFNAGYSALDDMFLVLEGTGTWAQFKSETAAVPADQLRRATEQFLRRARAWSQLEGVMIFLLLDRFSPDWQTRFMTDTLPSPFDALRGVVP